MHAIACCCQFWCVFLCCHSFSDFSRRYMRGNGIIKASSRYKQYLRLQPKIPTLHETGFSLPSFKHYFENFRKISKGLIFLFFKALATFTGYASKLPLKIMENLPNCFDAACLIGSFLWSLQLKLRTKLITPPRQYETV